MATITEKTILQAELVIPLKDGGKIVLGPNGLKIVGTKQNVQTPNFTMDSEGLKGFDAQGTLMVQWDTASGEIHQYGGQAGVPKDLQVFAMAEGLNITLMCAAYTSTGTLLISEVRAKYYAPDAELPQAADLRTADEGGTFAADGTTMIHVGCMGCSTFGAQYLFTSPAAGRWYYAWRLKNENGWSNWTDGNIEPEAVTDFIDTTDPSFVASGYPSSWTSKIIQSGSANQFYIEATRPSINGGIIRSALFQWKDGAGFDNIDSGNNQSVVHYNGTGVVHTYDPIRGEITAASGNFGNNGGVMLIDITGNNNFSLNNCVWVDIPTTHISGNMVWGLPALRMGFAANNGVYPNLVCKIVKPLSEWNNAAEGYYGRDGLDFQGYYEIATQNSGRAMLKFRSRDFTLPGNVSLANVNARVWFENDWSVNTEGSASVIVTDIKLPNEFPTGVYTNYLDGRYWERRVHPLWNMFIGNNTITFTSNAANGTNVSYANPMAGLFFRPHIIPDMSGNMEWRVTISNINVGKAIGTGTGSIIIGVGMWRPSDGNQSIMMGGAAKTANTTNNTNIYFHKVFCSGADGAFTTTSGLDSLLAGNNNANVVYVRLVMVQSGIYNNNTTHRWRYLASTDNSNWTEISAGSTTNTRHSYFHGHHPWIGVHAGPIMNDDFAGTITEFQIVSGIIIGDPGLVGQYENPNPAPPANYTPGTWYTLYSQRR